MELRDLYDENRNKTGEVISKNAPIPKGRYYLTVMVFIENSKGQFLLQQRSKEKGGQWATTGGHPKSGETSLQGLCTEIKEELGLDIKSNEPILYKTIRTEDDFLDLYYLKKDIDINSIVMQKEEVQNVAWFTKNEIKKMIKNGTFFKWHIEEYKSCLEFLNKQKELSNQEKNK